MIRVSIIESVTERSGNLLKMYEADVSLLEGESKIDKFSSARRQWPYKLGPGEQYLANLSTAQHKTDQTPVNQYASVISFA
jgi:hypothetical protein